MHSRLSLAALVAAVLGTIGTAGARAARPNVVVIITDDQGYGDLGVHGNPKIRTPNLDRLARQGVRLTQFHVSPVCSPTRASLLTGRSNYRTGVVDTFLGRSLMHPGEVTLAERLASAGYRTGIFGKWHLGDNAPLRPLEQGFRESLVLKGGGIGQPSDLPGGSHYLDPVLLRNGVAQKHRGYCSDVYTTAAIDFLKQSSGGPFFLYLAFNCPHDPLEAPEADLASYRGERLGRDAFPDRGNPLPASLDEEKIARVYAMVTNIDANVGRLLSALDDAGLSDDTIVVFLTDNGPAFARYNAGMRGLKGTVYEGGTRVPCFIRWPGRVPADREVAQVAAHIDLTPTLLDACQVPAKDGPPARQPQPAAPAPGRAGIDLAGSGGLPPVASREHAGRGAELRHPLRSLQVAPPGFRPARRQAPARAVRPRARSFERTDLARERPEVVSRLYGEYWVPRCLRDAGNTGPSGSPSEANARIRRR
ncbi:MAG: arylsulfatase [Isosphaeraceae bacterium]